MLCFLRQLEKSTIIFFSIHSYVWHSQDMMQSSTKLTDCQNLWLILVNCQIYFAFWHLLSILNEKNLSKIFFLNEINDTLPFLSKKIRHFFSVKIRQNLGTIELPTLK